jgi:hypothetical protein
MHSRGCSAATDRGVYVRDSANFRFWLMRGVYASERYLLGVVGGGR